MRYVAALLFVAACSEVAVDPPPAAEAGVDGGAPDAATPDAATYCPGADAAPSCMALDDPCGDGGITYECGGVGCPTGNVGACSLIEADPLGYRSSACCERKGCTRSYDHWCNPADGGPALRWVCPADAGEPIEMPPGKCRYELKPGPTTTVAQLCCTP